MKLQGFQSPVTTLDELIIAFNLLQTETKKLLNNGLQFDDNMNFASFEHTFSSSGTSETVAHGLGKIPVGWLTSYIDKEAIVYTSGTGGWTDAEVQLKCSLSGTSIEGYLF